MAFYTSVSFGKDALAMMEESACNLQCRYICCLMFSKCLSINLHGEQENLF